MKRQNFCENWHFGRAGETLSPVAVPHDAMLHGERAADAPGGSSQAYFPGGEYVYEKTFAVPAGELPGHALLQFEGVYKNARVFLNGKEAGGCAYGYLPFFVCLDGLLQEGENTVRVECENRDQPDSRWYSGAGLYRPVWLWTGPEVSLEPESVKIRTVSIDPAVIFAEAPEGAKIEILDGETVVASGGPGELSVPNARLWSCEAPNLYTCRATLGEDSAAFFFGIRTVTWDNKGLYVNGESVLLRGGCIHHDSGVLGAATWEAGELRRAGKLKEAGFNAIRSAHNPVSPAMLEACDRLGLYVMDEAWDMWFRRKSKYDYAGQWEENHLSDLKAIVDRDYNHPSVILYSIGNEVSEPAVEEGVRAEKEMVAYLHGIDPTRPVTGGFNLMMIASSARGKSIYKEEGGIADGNSMKTEGMTSTMFNMIASVMGTGMNKAANSRAADRATTPGLDALDVAGYNYASGRYPVEGEKHPNRLIFGSETFPQDIWKNWEMVEKYPYLVGDFMWTAWDYLGEVGIGAWVYAEDGGGFDKPYPWLLADAGAMDILGDPNGEMFWAQAAWDQLEKPAIAVRPLNHPGKKPVKATWRGTNAIPSWSWRGCEGNKTTVEVYTRAAYVELLLNDMPLGRERVKNGRAVYRNVKYAPGVLTAIACDERGRELSRNELKSAAGPVKIAALPEADTVKPGEAVYVDISLVGENGVVESSADRKLTVSVEGGELLGFGSANPRTEERFDSGSYTTYYGRALAVIRAGKSGVASVTVSDGQNEKATAEIPIVS